MRTPGEGAISTCAFLRGSSDARGACQEGKSSSRKGNVMPDILFVGVENALQYIARQNAQILENQQIIMQRIETMSKTTDQIAADILVIGADITQFVTGSQKAAADAKATIDAQASQITLLTSEEATDKAAAAAAVAGLATLKATSDASAAATVADEATALAAVDALKATADALNAVPAPVPPVVVPAPVVGP